jgi:NAD(P)-dependent dehydrogenase (short-subunit alcohol dehydrogenase family)
MRKPAPSSSGPSLLGTLAAAVGLTAAGYLIGQAVVRSRRHYDLTDKVAIVTGGSRGIGLAIARELIARGAKVTICARHADDLALAEDELAGRGDVLSVVCDVTQADEIRNVVEQTRARFGPIDVLVNNAANIVVGPQSHMKLADYRDAMDTIYEAALLFMLDVLPEMQRRGRGRIVNVASFGGKIPSPHLAPYAAAKHALVGLSESLRSELVNDGVYITTVCPGLVRSGSALRSAQFKGQHEKERAWFTAGDMTPVVSIDAGRLAARIVDALQNGDAELISPWPAAVQSSLHGLMPGLSTEVAGLVNRLLPNRSHRPDGDRAKRGDTLGADGLPAAVRRAQATAEDRYQHGAQPPATE